MYKSWILCPVLLVGCVFAGMLPGAEWGDLTARFAYDGPPPATPLAKITGVDEKFCCEFKPLDESLLVHPENRGVANVVLFLYVGRGDKQPPVHSAFAATEKAEVRLDNDKCRFDPHVVTMRTSQTLFVGNQDTIAHNSNFTPFDNKGYNPTIPSGGQEKLQFPIEERMPIKVTCSIHPWMGAWVVVKEHPYVGVTDANGRLEIKNLPAGEWTFQAWQEKAGYVSQVNRGGVDTKWKVGRFAMAIQPGQNDLGEIKLPASLFEKR